MRAWAWFTACQDNTACERLSSSRPSRLALRLRSGWALWLLKKHLLFFFSVPSWYSRSSICIPACFAGEASKHLRRIAMRTDASAVSSPPEPHLFGRQRRAECFGWNPAKMQAIDKIQACPPAVSKWEQYFPHAPPDVWAHLFLPCHWGHHLAETAPHTALI